MSRLHAHLSDAKIKQRDEIFKNNPVKQRFLCTAENVGVAFAGREYRELPEPLAEYGIKTCIYGESKVAFGLWQESSIIIVDSITVYNAERERFNLLWETAPLLQPKTAS
jgi:hypothetical protein